MDTADIIIIVLAALLGIVVLIGLYRLATRHLREQTSLKPSSETAPRQGLKTVITIFLSILILLGLFVTYRLFVSQ